MYVCVYVHCIYICMYTHATDSIYHRLYMYVYISMDITQCYIAIDSTCIMNECVQLSKCAHASEG